MRTAKVFFNIIIGRCRYYSECKWPKSNICNRSLRKERKKFGLENLSGCARKWP